MGLLSYLKSLTSPARYFGATVRESAGIGSGSKPRPFNYDFALRNFHSWAYAAAMLNANAFASTPKRLYARQRAGMKAQYATRPVSKAVARYLAGDSATQPSRTTMQKYVEFGSDVVEVVEPHPALMVLKTVSTNFDGFELDVLKMLDLQMAGNHYWCIVNGGFAVPEQIWRMPPQWTKVIASETQYVSGYEYGNSQQNMTTLGVDDVMHFKMPSPKSLYYGMGWFEAARLALGLHDSKRELDLATFDNYARPDWLLSVPGGNEAAMDKLEEKLKEKFAGRKKDKSAFLALSTDVKAQALQWDLREIGTSNEVIEEIAACSGVPVAMLLSNDPNRSSSESARLGWYRNTIQPYCRLDEEKLNQQWIPRFDGGEDLFIAHDPANFEDQTAMSNRATNLVKGGVLTPNEARAELGYAPHGKGDDLFSPVGATGGGPGINEGNNNE